jgi:transposase
MNDIISLLNLEDDTIEYVGTVIDGIVKTIIVEKKLTETYCPICGSRAYSRGIESRLVNHQILQDGYKLYIKVYYRKWKCTNNDCKNGFSDEFSFIDKHSRTTNMIPYLITEELRDSNVTLTQVADKFNLSDTHVHNLFMRYVDMKRMPLPEALCVDEVYMKIRGVCKYALVLLDFETGEIIDMIPSRLQKDTNAYFKSIPLTERDNVKYLMCDMYNEYISYTKKHFNNAICIVDSFHVIQWIISKINVYINSVKRKFYKQRMAKLAEQNDHSNIFRKNNKRTNEEYILDKFRWIILSNYDDLKFTSRKYTYKKLNQRLNTEMIEKLFLDIDPRFKKIRDAKEKYIRFNRRNIGDPIKAKKELEELIKEYSKSDLEEFNDFSILLKKYKKYIINSFNTVTTNEINECGETRKIVRRLSNGPIESVNRKPKDLKRAARGFRNFAYVRNRLLWITREKSYYSIIPKSEKDIHYHTEKKRGKYKKNK